MNKYIVHAIITLLAILIFTPGLGLVQLFDWDELNFAESAREMHASNNGLYVQMAFEPFWEKPPLFIWIQAVFISLFGEHTWVYRLPNAISGVIAVNMAYHIGCFLKRRSLGVFWALTLACTFAPLLYFKLGIIDPIFNLLILLSIWHWYRITRCQAESTRPHWHYLLSGFFLGLAILTKGQAALIIVGIVILLTTALQGRWNDVFSLRFLVFILAMAGIVFSWLIPVYRQLGSQFFEAFIGYQIELVKGQIQWHNQPWFYHPIVLFFVCFPAAAFAAPYLLKKGKEDFGTESWHFFLRLLFWVVLIIFSIVGTKIIHYSSLCWYPITYFAAYHTYLIHTNRGKTSPFQKVFLLVSALGILIAMTGLPLVFGRDTLPEWILPHLDLFAKGLMQKHSAWTWTSIIPSALMVVWILPWIVNSSQKTHKHPAYIFVYTGLVSLGAYFFLLPPAAELLQAELISTIKTETTKTQLLETHGFKTYALYFHGNVTSEDFQGPWLTDTFVQHRVLHSPYPNQFGKRIYIIDVNPSENKRIITKCDFVADTYFRYQFAPIDTLGAYWVWQRK